MPAVDLKNYLDPRVLARINRLDLKARLIVEGFISGRHQSPFHGSSVEFAEHREYVPGDDIRRINWKVYAKSDRYCIKQFEEETNLKSTILLDVSESMNYRSGALSKHAYATCIAAALAYLLLHQQDAVGLALFDGDVRRFVPPSSHPSHLMTLLGELEREGAPRGPKTDLARILHHVAEKVKKRGMVVVISDFFDDVSRVLRGLHHLRHRRHEVLVFHVLDAAELEFPFRSVTLFEGLEDSGEVLADTVALRERYRAEIGRFVAEIRRGCLDHRIDYCLVDTSRPLDVALSAFLAARLRR